MTAEIRDDGATRGEEVGDTAEEIDKLRGGGDGHIVIWAAPAFWRSLIRLDLIDELPGLDA